MFSQEWLFFGKGPWRVWAPCPELPVWAGLWQARGTRVSDGSYCWFVSSSPGEKMSIIITDAIICCICLCSHFSGGLPWCHLGLPLWPSACVCTMSGMWDGWDCCRHQSDSQECSAADMQLMKADSQAHCGSVLWAQHALCVATNKPSGRMVALPCGVFSHSSSTGHYATFDSVRWHLQLE